MRKQSRESKFHARNRDKNGGVWVHQGAGMIVTVMWFDERMKSFTRLRDALDYAESLQSAKD